MKRKHGLLMKFSLFGILLLFLVSCNKGPSEKQLLDDYIDRVGAGSLCNDCVHFKAVKLLRKTIEGNEAELVVEVTGDWKAGCPDAFTLSTITPCIGFGRGEGANQVKKKRLFYQKYDTGWHLEHILD